MIFSRTKAGVGRIKWIQRIYRKKVVKKKETKKKRKISYFRFYTETTVMSRMMMSNYVVSSRLTLRDGINNKPSVLHDMSWHTMHLPHWRMSRRGKGMTSIRWRVEKGLDEHLFYSVRPLHLFLAFGLREYLLNALPYSCTHRARSLSLS